MALLAEQLVDEWLNRAGFFTMRGVKRGVAEIDLLGIRIDRARTEIEAWHVEVQVSFRPVSYIGRLTSDEQQQLGVRHPNSAKRRPTAMLAAGTKAWVNKKFGDQRKISMREACWPGLSWVYTLVHGEVHETEELSLIRQQGVVLVPFSGVLSDLCGSKPGQLFGAAGSDIAEIVKYFSCYGNQKAAE